MLGIRVERDARHVEESGFLSDISGVGDDAFGVVDKIAEVEVTLWREDVQIRSIDFQLLDSFLHVGMQRGDAGHTFGFLDQGLHQRIEHLFLCQ